MKGEPIKLLNEAVKQFHRNLTEDPLIAIKVDIGMVTFNHNMIYTDFVNATEFKPPVMHASGGTKLSFALSVALDMVAKRKDVYRINGIPPTPSTSQHELNPPSEKQDGHILLTPTRWIPEQMQNLIPATRNAIQAIIVSPRQRATLVAVLAVVMVAAGGIFVYLIRRRNSVPDQQNGLEHPEIR